MRYEHPLIASLLIGIAQEADPVSPGFKQSTAISNRSTLDFTLHCSEQQMVLPSDASWKRLCSSSVPPDDDDNVYITDIISRDIISHLCGAGPACLTTLCSVSSPRCSGAAVLSCLCSVSGERQRGGEGWVGHHFSQSLCCSLPQQSFRLACCLISPIWAYIIVAWWPDRRTQIMFQSAAFASSITIRLVRA